ncbi:c-type cytochrome [Oricola thermophila]|uniref:C-type cytochrome n=1 Tax=Oricola thermophila TaxID=2742145 RepID=A0A6N1VF10_9HYPH|nr:c-type cytochrome [Oricola thermophila]QKV17587.1 c-type cytochrome [Oricola thermophila]
MLKYLKASLLTVAVATLATQAAAQDPAQGEKVFRKCAACHSVGEGAKSRVGPHLNDLFGRKAGTVDGFKYSAAMVAAGEGGIVWDERTLTQFLIKPRDLIKGTRMAFAGLRTSGDVANVLEYLKTFDKDMAASVETAEAPTGEEKAVEVAKADAPALAADAPLPDHDGVFGLGRVATDDEIAAWDIDVRPDGTGLPVGRGTVADGEVLYTDNCAVCHGDFGEAVGRWPVLAGGHDTLTDERPEKTIGSYWPYLSTVYDYVRRAMPFGNARSLSDDDVYAITAYLLYLNDIVDDENFELSNENFAEVRLPNEDNFIPDDRLKEPHYADKKEACMTDCKPGPVEITMRARVLDVTPEGGDDDESVGGGID